MKPTSPRFDMAFTILTARIRPEVWEHIRQNVEGILKGIPLQEDRTRPFVEVKPFLWIFRTAECFGAIHELEHLFARSGVTFLSIPHDGPLPCWVKPEVENALRGIGVVVWNLATGSPE